MNSVGFFQHSNTPTPPLRLQPKHPSGVDLRNVHIMNVRPAFKILVCVLGGTVLAGTVGAVPDSPSGQYQAISERNVFGLHPPPAQPAPTSPAAPLPKITLTGITTILGNKRALMKVAPAVLKPGDTNKELSLILTEGQREGEIEVLQIDENVGSVKINNSGTVMLVTFEKDGAKLPASLPVLSGSLMTAAAMPNSVRGPANPYSFLPRQGGQRGLTTRIPRLPAPNTPGLSPGGVPTPDGAAPIVGQTPSISSQDLTAEEQAIINEFQRQANPNTTPVLPPTALSPGAAQQTESAIPITGANGQVQGQPPVLVPQ
jgi:hypothetical protein